MTNNGTAFFLHGSNVGLQSAGKIFSIFFLFVKDSFSSFFLVLLSCWRSLYFSVAGFGRRVLELAAVLTVCALDWNFSSSGMLLLSS